MDDTCEDKAKPQHAVSSEIRYTLTEFIDAVKGAIGLEEGTDWNIDVKDYFGVDETKLVSIETEFPLYQQSQACYAINKFLEKYSDIVKIIGYSGETHCAPKYGEMQIMRDKTVPLLIRAWVYTKWKDVKLVVHILFDGNYSEFKIFGAKEDNKTIHDLSTEVKKWMKKNNFLRGEKLEYLPRGTLGFLEY